MSLYLRVAVTLLLRVCIRETSAANFSEPLYWMGLREHYSIELTYLMFHLTLPELLYIVQIDN